LKLSVGDVLAMIGSRHFAFRTFPVSTRKAGLVGLLPEAS